jgi:hypothetical protein
LLADFIQARDPQTNLRIILDTTLVPNMVVVDSWKSMDQLQRTDFKWVNYICQKLSGS